MEHVSGCEIQIARSNNNTTLIIEFNFGHPICCWGCVIDHLAKFTLETAKDIASGKKPPEIN